MEDTGPSIDKRKVQGVAAAIAAYVAWGFLSPGAKLLLEYGGPWTINFHRTWLSLLVFLVLFGPNVSVRTAKGLARDVRLWILGIGGLGFTFVFYMYSVDRLEPTVATVLLYLAPLLIAFFAHRFLGEALHPWAYPTAILTLVGVLVAALTPSDGFTIPTVEAAGIALGLVGTLGWVFYTLYLGHASRFYGERELTLAAFATSGLLFLAGALLLEGVAFHITTRSLLLLAAYVAFPSVASFLLYAVAVGRAGAGTAGVLLGIELLATAVVSWLVTDETFGPDKIAGLLIVLVAVTAFLWAQRHAAGISKMRA